MNTDKLAPVYLDNQPVRLEDPKPKVSTILSHLGKPDTTAVKWLKSQGDPQGKALMPGEVVDRTAEPSKPIYLTSTAGKGKEGETATTKDMAGSPSFAAGAKAKPRQPGNKEFPDDPDPDMGKKVDEAEDTVETDDEESRDKRTPE